MTSNSAAFLKDIGYELINGLAVGFPSSKVIVPQNDWEYLRIELKDGFNIRFCRWRQGNMPAYIILYDGNKYVFELDLSMLVLSGESYTWYLKKKVTNPISRKVVEEFCGGSKNFPNKYRDLMLDNKRSMNSGKDTPSQGFPFVIESNFEEVVAKLTSLLESQILAHKGKTHSNNKPKELSEARDDDLEKIQLRATRIRQGQITFRQNLLRLYEGKCAITGYSPAEALDACHVQSHSVKGNNQSDNGILLRSDLHNLFDRGLLKIHYDSYRVILDETLSGTEYWKLNGKKIRSKFRPRKEYLRARFEGEDDT